MSVTPQTRELINDRMAASIEQGFSPIAETGSDPKSYYDYYHGGDRSTGILDRIKKASEPQDLNIGFGKSGINSAIQKRSEEKYFNKDEVKKMRELNYLKNYNNNINRAKNIALGQMRLDSAALQQQINRAAAEDAQRSGLITSLFTIAGTVAGAYFGAAGGPAGAAAGAQAGAAAGGAVGGTVANSK